MKEVVKNSSESEVILKDPDFWTRSILSGQSFKGEIPEKEMNERRIQAEYHYKQFLESLGYDVDRDPSLQGTPSRVVKMWMKEIGRGTYEPLPKITVFPNNSSTAYDGIVAECGISVKSFCSHHNYPFYGHAHCAYIPGKGEDSVIIGLSKLNRLVDYYSRRPQVQEQLTVQIHNALNDILKGNLGVAVQIEASHTCVSQRGVNDSNSEMKTTKLSGAFLDPSTNARSEFLHYIDNYRK